MDYYQRLEVSRASTEEEIKKAYRRLAMKWHPDRNLGNKEAEEEFKRVQEAYDTLGNEEKRSLYDSRFGYFFNKEEEEVSTAAFSEETFSASRRYSATQAELDVIPCQFFGDGNVLIHVTVSKEELVSGTMRAVKWKKRVKCRACSGDNFLSKCKACKGKGIGDMLIEEMMIVIPPGTSSGHQVIVRGRGEYSGENWGNLHIVILG